VNYAIIEKLTNEKAKLVATLRNRLEKVTKAMRWVQVDLDHAELGLIIVIGGDGTMIHAMKVAAELPTSPDVIGINIGKLGFLAEIDPKSIEEFFVKYEIGMVKSDSRSMIEGWCGPGDNWVTAVNELVVVPKETRETLKYELVIDGVSSGTHHANGLVLATPTGSTAYSLSVGGAIIQPNTPVFQIAPIAAVSLNSRPVIVSDDAKIRIQVFPKVGVVYQLLADGQVVVDDMTTTLSGLTFDLHFRKSKKSPCLIHALDWNFFDVLRTKLGWSTIV